MNKIEDIKEQVILLFIITAILIIISIILNIFYVDKENELNRKNMEKDNTKNENIIETNEELSINGITESELRNMKGLIDENTYKIYQDYFDNKGNKSIEQLEIERAKEDNNSSKNSNVSINNGGIDYISESEQEELEKDLQEALKKYGYK